MPRPTIIDRARLYLAKVPGAVSGGGGHNQTFAVACALVKGFDLSIDDARPLLSEWNQGCLPPWSARELEHKLRQADTVADTEPRGYLAGDNVDTGKVSHASPAPFVPPTPKPEFDADKLRDFAAEWARKVDLLWLANRSEQDPSTVSASDFLAKLYKPGERVLAFINDKSQGDAVWPEGELPSSGPRGVWFLAQPVDGEYHPNPRSVKNDGVPKMSRRSEESVTSWRYMVLESDEAPLRLWLGALVQLPLRIAAIYSSGGRSIHALVRVDARTKPEWDAEKRAMMNGLVILGADPGAMSAVRLTRLPGCYRQEKKAMQKLLYIQPEPKLRPLAEAPVLRDVEEYWLAQAENGVADADETGGEWIRRGLHYYSPVSKACAVYFKNFKTPPSP